jgi:hypothetical protein
MAWSGYLPTPPVVLAANVVSTAISTSLDARIQTVRRKERAEGHRAWTRPDLDNISMEAATHVGFVLGFVAATVSEWPAIFHGTATTIQQWFRFRAWYRRHRATRIVLRHTLVYLRLQEADERDVCEAGHLVALESYRRWAVADLERIERKRLDSLSKLGARHAVADEEVRRRSSLRGLGIAEWTALINTFQQRTLPMQETDQRRVLARLHEPFSRAMLSVQLLAARSLDAKHELFTVESWGRGGGGRDPPASGGVAGGPRAQTPHPQPPPAPAPHAGWKRQPRVTSRSTKTHGSRRRASRWCSATKRSRGSDGRPQA